MNSTPAQVSDASQTIVASSPHAPGEGRKIEEVKCSATITHPVSHNLETGIWLRREIDAKALASRITAPRSGSLLQSNPLTSHFVCSLLL